MRGLTLVIFSVIPIIVSVCSVVAQTPSQPDDIYWSDQFFKYDGGSPNDNTDVYDLLEFDGKLIVAGDFLMYGSSPTPNIVAWDGSYLESLGDGLPGYRVKAISLYKETLIAVTLDNINGSGGSIIYQWTDDLWEPISDPIVSSVEEIIEWDGYLIAVGSFDSIGTVKAPSVAAWDGTNWQPLGGGIDGYITATAVHKGRLIVAGDLRRAGGEPVGNLISWDGNSWTQLSNQINGIPWRVMVWQDQLIIEGDFTNVDGVLVPGIAVYNGTDWTGIGNVTADYLATDGDILYGRLPDPNISAGMLGRWETDHWEVIGPMVNGLLECATVWNKDYALGGRLLQYPDTYLQPGFFVWQDGDWRFPRGLGLQSESGIFHLNCIHGSLYAGAWFGFSPLPSAKKSDVGIVRFEGTDWTTLEEMNISTMQVSDTKEINGQFYFIDIRANMAEDHLYRWDGSVLDTMPTRGLGYLGARMGSYKSQLVITARGYEPNQPITIYRWNDAQWEILGTIPRHGLGETVSAFSNLKGDLFVGGRFDSINGLAVNNIARYDGEQWHPLEDGLFDQTFGYCASFINYMGKLLCTGNFTNAGTIEVNDIALWEGSQWSSIGGVTKPHPLAADVKNAIMYRGDLYVTGYFEAIDNVPAKNIASYDGTDWHPLGSGLTQGPTWDTSNARGFALEVYQGALYVGGEFQRAGGKASLNIACWEPKGKLTDYEEPDPVNIATLPENYLLEQNYPNPFNPTTIISFQLDHPAEVTLTIYNTLGQTVRTLIKGNTAAGVHQVEWDGRNDNGSHVATGIYLYRLATGNQTEARKMILLK